MPTLGKTLFCAVSALFSGWAGYAFLMFIVGTEYRGDPIPPSDVALLLVAVTHTLLAVAGAFLFGKRFFGLLRSSAARE